MSEYNHREEAKLEINEKLAQLIGILQNYTAITGRYFYVDVYPLDPELGKTAEYTYEVFTNERHPSERD